MVLGLVVGKTVGISAASWLAVRLGWADLPSGVTWRHLIGAAALGGIGFTVSLFIAALAFEDPVLVDKAKIGVLAASVLATVPAFAAAARARDAEPAGQGAGQDRPRASRTKASTNASSCHAS